jgi:hypothetical protein
MTPGVVDEKVGIFTGSRRCVTSRAVALADGPGVTPEKVRASGKLVEVAKVRIRTRDGTLRLQSRRGSDQ